MTMWVFMTITILMEVINMTKLVIMTNMVTGRKEGNVLFNDALNTFYLRLYGIRHMVKDHSDSEKGNPLLPHRLLFPINSKDFLYAPSHRQDSTYHGLCYTSRGALAGTKNSSMGSPHEGSIRRPIANMVTDKGVYDVVYNKDKDNDNNGDCDEDNTYLPYNYITRVPLFIIYWQLDMSYLVIVPTLRGTLQYCSICSLGCFMCSTIHEATYMTIESSVVEHW